MNESALALEVDEDVDDEDEDEDDYEVEQNGEPAEEDDEESRSSESSEEEVTDSSRIQEDMERLQNCFEGFRKQYRLIKRIGEGVLPPCGLPPLRATPLLTPTFQAHFLLSTKRRICYTIGTTTRGTWKRKQKSGRRHH
jgi:hypothetical protein